MFPFLTNLFLVKIVNFYTPRPSHTPRRKMKASYTMCLLGASTSYGLNVGQTIQTSSGPVRGHAATVNNNVSTYLGIPYAVPPLGNLRFMPPINYNGNTTINGSSIVSFSLLRHSWQYIQIFTLGIRLSSCYNLFCSRQRSQQLQRFSCEFDGPRNCDYFRVRADRG